MASAPSERPTCAHDSRQISGINWLTSSFLIGTLLIALSLTPIYIWRFGFGALELTLFLSMFVLSGMSITAGYHRLFAHKAFRARWPLRLSAALFGAATFEMSILQWCSEHRYHHKHTDDVDDPHGIHHGFFWAHVGWLLVELTPEHQLSNVDDLRRDRIVAWQHRHYLLVAIAMGFLLPMAVGAVWGWLAHGAPLIGLLGGFLFGGCLRIVVVQHLTFLINSWAHSFGRRPYDRSVSARDSGLLALFTFGEGYHNYHHAFQNDYRNGVRPWQFDPTKWSIWLFSKLGLTANLRRVPLETIRLAQLKGERALLDRRLGETQCEISQALSQALHSLESKLEEIHLRFRQLRAQSARLAERGRAERKRKVRQLQREIRSARREFRSHFKAWRLMHRQAWALA